MEDVKPRWKEFCGGGRNRNKMIRRYIGTRSRMVKRESHTNLHAKLVFLNNKICFTINNLLTCTILRVSYHILDSRVSNVMCDSVVGAYIKV